VTAKAISFTPEVLKAKLRALEEHGRFQTRRPIVVPRVGYVGADLSRAWADPTSHFGSCLKVPCDDETVQRLFPKHQQGDRLWVRERARVLEYAHGARGPMVRLAYEVDGTASAWLPYPSRLREPTVGHCIPNGVHREGARHFLEVADVYAERVAELSADDAVLEGINPSDVAGLGGDESLRQAFFAIYDSIYGDGAHSRGWCWGYTLKRAEP